MEEETTDVTEQLEVVIDGACARIVLDRPEVLNALSSTLLAELDEALRRVDVDERVRVVVLEGRGPRAFSVGADLHEVGPQRAAQRPRVRAHPDVTRPGALPGFDALMAMSTPVVAAIDGYCAAGGFELALLCDIRLATVASSFWLPEPRLGMLGGPALVELSRAIPTGEAMWLHLTGQRMSAQRAYDVGLVQQLADDREGLDACVAAVVEGVASASLNAVQFVRRVVRDGRELSVQQQWRFAEMFNLVLRRDDADVARAQDWQAAR